MVGKKNTKHSMSVSSAINCSAKDIMSALYDGLYFEPFVRKPTHIKSHLWSIVECQLPRCEVINYSRNGIM